MDKEQAIQKFLEFKEEYLVSRDKSIEIFSFFKFNPNENKYTCLVNNAPVTIKKDEFWNYINTSIIREVYKKNKPQSEIEITDTEATPTDYTKLRKECITVKNKLNFERNIFNKKLKDLSLLEELNQDIIECLKKLQPTGVTTYITYSGKSLNDDVLVAVITDTHGGEISAEFKDTGFDFTILSKRLKKYADTIKKEITNNKYNKCVLLCAGDLCNNVTLLSKRLNQTSNRATTIVMMIKLLQDFILDIYSVCPNITFAGVCSNESRNDLEYHEDEYLITNCADYTIYNVLEMLFKNISTVKFLGGRNCEKVVQVNGQNILLTHGVGISKGDIDKSIQQAISRYSVKGVKIRYVTLGHIHSQLNSSYFARSGSLCGSNAYSNSTLNLQSRASQSMFTVSKNGDIHTYGVDLENVDNIKGYDISNEIKKFALKGRDTRADLDLIQYA